MTAAHVKKGLFVILLAVAAYIWWGNIQSLTSNRSDESGPPVGQVQSASLSPKTTLFPYVPPQVNPFRGYSPAPIRSGETVKPRPADGPFLHSTHKLRGIVGKGSLAQAIVQLPDRSTKIISAGDSVESWQLREIKDLYATFLNGKRHDTMFLDTKGL